MGQGFSPCRHHPRNHGPIAGVERGSPPLLSPSTLVEEASNVLSTARAMLCRPIDASFKTRLLAVSSITPATTDQSRGEEGGEVVLGHKRVRSRARQPWACRGLAFLSSSSTTTPPLYMLLGPNRFCHQETSLCPRSHTRPPQANSWVGWREPLPPYICS